MCLLSLMVSYLFGYIYMYMYIRTLSMRGKREEGEDMKRGDKIYFGKLNYSWPFRQSGISYFE